MDNLTFIAEIIKAIVWPLTIIFGILILREPITNLIPFMRKLKYNGIEMEFSEKIQTIKTEIKIDDKIEINNAAMSIVPYSTRAAVIEAWIEFETEAAKFTASSVANSDAIPVRNKNWWGYLRQSGVFNDRQLRSINELRQLRNQLVHTEKISLTESDAKDYIMITANLVNIIHSKMFKIKQGL